MRLLELANAYACLARLGQYKPYRLLPDSSVNSPPPTAPIRPPMPTLPALPREARGEVSSRRPAAAYLIADILSDNDARTLAFGAESPLRCDFRVACKTGTSSDFRDNWAFGYTPEFTVGIWAGNFDGSPMQHVSGVTGAAPLLHDILVHLHQLYRTTWYSAPDKHYRMLDPPRHWQTLEPDRARRHQREIPRPKPSPARNPLRLRLCPLALRTSHFALRSPPSSRVPDWLASADNWLGDRAVLASAPDSLRILFRCLALLSISTPISPSRAAAS